MRLGNFDKKISILQRSITTNPDNGEQTFDYIPFTVVRAQEVRKKALDKSYAVSDGGRDVSLQTIEERVIYNIRYIPNLNTKYRVQYGSNAYNIVSVREVGRKQFMELECLAINGDINSNDVQH